MQTRAAARVVSEELLAQIEMALASCTPPDAELEKVKIPNTSFFPICGDPISPICQSSCVFLSFGEKVSPREIVERGSQQRRRAKKRQRAEMA